MALLEPLLLHTQARLLQASGGLWLALGLVLGHDPLSTLWQACAAGLSTMVVGGALLRLASNHIVQHLEQVSAEAEEAQRKAAQAAAEAEEKARSARPRPAAPRSVAKAAA